jgi:hypothetical protein
MSTFASDKKPQFMVNAPILISMNDEMAIELIKFFKQTLTGAPLPPSVFAFMKQLENDLDDK